MGSEMCIRDSGPSPPRTRPRTSPRRSPRRLREGRARLSCHGIRQTLEGSFSAVSKLNFASKYSLESSRRDLHNALLCTAFGIHNRKLGKKSLAKTTPKRKKTRKREAIKQLTACHRSLISKFSLKLLNLLLFFSKIIIFANLPEFCSIFATFNQKFSGFFQNAGAARKNTKRSATGRQRGADSAGPTAEGRPSMAY